MQKFRTLKARKAKHGFIQYVHLDTLEQLHLAHKDIMQWDPQALVVLDLDMNRKEFKVYTDSDKAAELFSAAYC